MTKINAKNLAIFILAGVLLLGVIKIVNAQQTLPTGGNSFETAVKLEPGNYQGGSSLDNKEAEYFYITGIKAGQEISIKGTFSAANVEVGAWAILGLYDKNKTELTGKDGGFYDKPLSLTISWLHKGNDSDKYYIKTECDAFKIGSYLLDVSLTKAPTEEKKATTPAIEEEKGGTTETEKEVTAPSEVITGTEKTNAEKMPAEEKGLNWTLILGIIAAIIVVGIVVYFLSKKKKQ